VIVLTHSEAIKTGVTVRTQLASYLPRVRGDRMQLQQVMLNLIVNRASRRSAILLMLAATYWLVRGHRGLGNLVRLFESFLDDKAKWDGRRTFDLSNCYIKLRELMWAHYGLQVLD
jgi:hypothetical protein